MEDNNWKLDSRSKHIFLIMGVGILILILDSLWFKGWVSAAYWGIGISAAYGIYALLKKDEIIKKIWLFALVAGFTELFADYYLVEYTHTLVYPAEEPMIWASPFYMPFSWLAVLVQVGYIGWWLSYRIGQVKSAFALLILGAILIPLYEHWAINAGWWSYQNAPMLGEVPYYISLAEGLLMLSIPFLLRIATAGRNLTGILMGLIQGMAMLVASFIAYNLLG